MGTGMGIPVLSEGVLLGQAMRPSFSIMMPEVALLA